MLCQRLYKLQRGVEDIGGAHEELRNEVSELREEAAEAHSAMASTLTGVMHENQHHKAIIASLVARQQQLDPTYEPPPPPTLNTAAPNNLQPQHSGSKVSGMYSGTWP